jgi:hypothetical protein
VFTVATVDPDLVMLTILAIGFVKLGVFLTLNRNLYGNSGFGVTSLLLNLEVRCDARPSGLSAMVTPSLDS